MQRRAAERVAERRHRDGHSARPRCGRQSRCPGVPVIFTTSSGHAQQRRTVLSRCELAIARTNLITTRTATVTRDRRYRDAKARSTVVVSARADGHDRLGDDGPDQRRRAGGDSRSRRRRPATHRRVRSRRCSSTSATAEQRARRHHRAVGSRIPTAAQGGYTMTATAIGHQPAIPRHLLEGDRGRLRQRLPTVTLTGTPNRSRSAVDRIVTFDARRHGAGTGGSIDPQRAGDVGSDGTVIYTGTGGGSFSVSASAAPAPIRVTATATDAPDRRHGIDGHPRRPYGIVCSQRVTATAATRWRRCSSP